MDVDLKIDGESVLLHDNAATIIYALRALKTVEEFDRVRFAIECHMEDLSEQSAKESGDGLSDL